MKPKAVDFAAAAVAASVEALPVEYAPWSTAVGPKVGKKKRQHRNKIARRERARQAKQRNY